MYVALPIYASCSLGSRRIALPLVAVASIAAAVYFEAIAPTQVQPVVYRTSVPSTIKLMPYFVIGALFQCLRFEKYLNLQIAFIFIGLLPILSVTHIIYHTAIIILTPYIVLSFALAEISLFASLGEKRDISYGVYLWAFPIQQTLIFIARNTLSPILLFGAASVLTYGVAYLSAKYVEAPALRWKPKRRTTTRPLQATSDQ